MHLSNSSNLKSGLQKDVLLWKQDHRAFAYSVSSASGTFNWTDIQEAPGTLTHCFFGEQCV